MLFNCQEGTRFTFEVFYRLLLGDDEVPTEEEVKIALESTEEWKAELALKFEASKEKKNAILHLVREKLRPRFVGMGSAAAAAGCP